MSAADREIRQIKKFLGISEKRRHFMICLKVGQAYHDVPDK
jgi:hypothetical protein